MSHARCGVSTTFGSFSQRVALRQGLGREHVEAGGREPTGAQGLDQGRLVDEAAAGGVDQDGAGPHAGEGRTVDQALGLGSRAAGAGKRCRLFRGGRAGVAHAPGASGLGCASRVDRGAHGPQHGCQELRDRAVADEAHGAAADLAEAVHLGCRPLPASARAQLGVELGMRRRPASIRAKVSSATARLLVPGMLQTAMPRARAASRSIVFTPTPIFWIRRSSARGAISAAVTGSSTCQMTSASGRASASAASSPGAAILTSIPCGELPQPARQGRARLILKHDMAHPDPRAPYGLARPELTGRPAGGPVGVPHDILAVLRRAGLLEIDQRPERPSR